MRTILTNCTVIDCTGKPPRQDMSIVIEDGRIAVLQSGTIAPTVEGGGFRVLDLEGGYVLPGLWSAHAHPGEIFPDVERVMYRESAIDCAIRYGRNCMDALRMGVTGIRTLGERDSVDVAWKRAFNAGVFVGPRLFESGVYICATGGFGHMWPGAVEVDGPYEMRRVVREQLKLGVDEIKLMLTGNPTTGPDGGLTIDTEFLLDEVEAAVEVAHQKGKRVSAHAGGQAAKTAIRAGVDCIEHGYFLDDEAVEMMVENDIFYVPTLVCILDLEWLRESGVLDIAPGDRSRAHEGRVLIAEGEGLDREYANVHLEGFQKALKAGVKMAPGGDSNPAGEFTLLEIEHMVRAGMGEMEALIAATRTCTDLCGVSDRLGTVEVGKLADLVVLSANPLENISNIRKLRMVLKGGDLVDTVPQEGLTDIWKLCL